MRTTACPVGRQPLSPIIEVRLQRSIEHLHRLGARAVAELVLALADRTGALDEALNLLAEYQRLTPAQVRVAGGHRFPPRPLRLAPDRGAA